MYNNVQLPVSHTQIDTSFWDPNLPGSNQVTPGNLQLLPGCNPDLAKTLIAHLRTLVQSRAQKSPVHTFTYNMFQANGFQNQTFFNFCRLVTDLGYYLSRTTNDLNTIVSNATQRTYKAMLCSLYTTYPALQQTITPEVDASLRNEIASTNQLFTEMSNFRNGFGQQQPTAMVQSPMVTNQIVGNTGYQQIVGNNVPQHQGNNGAGYIRPIIDNSNVPVMQPSKPTSSWTSSSGVSLVPNGPIQTQQPTVPVMQTTVAQEPGIVDTIVNPPSFEEILIDPKAYIPQGFQLNVARPYDEFRAPGGVVIKPSYLAPELELTKSSVPEYATLYDPNKYIGFKIKWADNVVKEKVVAFDLEMDYLRHEINEKLRAKALRPKGIVVPVKMKEVEVKESQDTQDYFIRYDNPVVVKAAISGSLEFDSPAIAETEVREIIGDDYGALPPYIYLNVNEYPLLDLGDESVSLLESLSTNGDLPGIANFLKERVGGELQLRTYTYINKRMTKAYNDFIQISLSEDGLAIDDFVEDQQDLHDLLIRTQRQHYADLIRMNGRDITKRATNLVLVEDQPSIIDARIIYQTDLALDEIAPLNIHDDALLVTGSSHPAILKALGQISKLLCDSEDEFFRNYNPSAVLVTVDGYSLDVHPGRLTKGAQLLKLRK